MQIIKVNLECFYLLHNSICFADIIVLYKGMHLWEIFIKMIIKIAKKKFILNKT